MNDHLRQEIDALLADKAGEAQRTQTAVDAALAANNTLDEAAAEQINTALNPPPAP